MAEFLIFFAPDIIFICGVLFLFNFGLWNYKETNLNKKSFYMFILFFSSLILLSSFYVQLLLETDYYLYYHQSFIRNPLIIYSRAFIYVIALIVLIFVHIDNNKILSIPLFEFTILFLLSVEGMVLLLSANNLFLIYLLIELTSLNLFILIAAYKNSNLAIEASFRYYIMAVFSSALLLFGVSICYTYFGTLNLSTLKLLFENTTSPNIMATFSLSLILCGIFFKLAIVPFHFWIADVYQGACLSVTAIFAILTKIPFFILFLKLFHLFCLYNTFFYLLVYYCSILSILVGTILSLYEPKMKKFLAYSSIAQFGFILLGFTVQSPLGVVASLVYLLVYILNSITIFAILLLFTKFQSNMKSIFLLDNIKNLFHISKLNTILSFIFICSILSLGGVPPFSGFFGKYFIFSALIAEGDYITVILGILLSVVALFAYIKLIRLILFDDTTPQSFVNINITSKFLVYIIIITFLFNIFFIFFQANIFAFLVILITNL